MPAGVDVWDRSHSALTTSTLSAYPQAVWMTGNESRDTFTSLDQELVQGYLAAGGQLLVTGQDIAYDMRRTDFLRRTLRTWYDRDNSRVWRVQGLDMDFHIDADEGAGNQSEPDEVNGMYGGSVILRYPSQYPQGAGVLYTRRTRVALLGFGLEAVTPASSRAELLVRLLAKLAGEDDGAAAAALRRRLAQRSRFQVRGR